MPRSIFPALTTGLLLTATAPLALPTDMGRSADVYTNAIRYFEARASNPNNWPSPEMRPTVVAEPVPLYAPSNIIAGAPSDVIMQVAEAIAAAELTSAPSVTAETQDLTSPVIADLAEEAVQTEGVATADVDTSPVTPELIAPDEATIEEADIALAANDIAIEVADPSDVDADLADLEAAVVEEVDLASIVEPAQDPQSEGFVFPEADVTAQVNEAAVVETVAAVVEDAEQSPGSSRTTPLQDPDVIAAAAAIDDAVEAADDGDLMAEMADADENLIVREGEDGVDTMMMSSDVLFSFGKAELAEDALETLASIGDMAADIPVLEVFGHTDAIGSESNNLALGQKRAEAVRDWLLQNTAFTEDRVIATGIGEVDPVAPNVLENGDDNPEGRAQNRRVEFAFHEAGYAREN